MAREYARIRISIASDRDFEDLTPAAQWFFTRILIPEPTLNHCGVADWRPRRLLGKARGLTVDYLLECAAECESGRYALFDDQTEEVLARSYIRTEELLRNPKMATAVISSYRAIASKVLRAAVVSEIRRARDEHPEYSSWKAGDVGVQLGEIMEQPGSDQVPYVDTFTNQIGNRNGNHAAVPISNSGAVPITNPVPGADYQSDSAPIPCNLFPADTSKQLKEGGYVSPEGHQELPPTSTEPPRRCPKHEDADDPPPCGACAEARRTNDRWNLNRQKAEQARANAEHAERRTQAAESRSLAIAECQLCDDDGYRDSQPCHHDPDQDDTNARGRELLRAVMAGEVEPPDIDEDPDR
jgi:hypothetical protein